MNKIFILIIISLFFLKEIIFANTQDDTYINTENIFYDEKIYFNFMLNGHFNYL